MMLLLSRKLDFAIKNDLSERVLTCIVEELKALSIYHFISEENLMHEVGYPETVQHSAMHSQLLKTLEEMTAGIVQHKTSEFKLLEFFHDWLISHMQHADAELGNYVKLASARPIGEKFYKHFLVYRS
jgi:hemerythrin-like metal-binding protein